MKKKWLAMLLAVVMAVGLLPGTAWAVENQTANLTPEISAAYLHIIENLYQLYGAPYKSGETAYTGEEEAAVYYGMCGGYIVDFGDGGYPEMIVAYSQDSISGLGIHYPNSYIRVYAWNGTEAVSVFEEQVLASGNGRAWDSYILRQSGNIAWLDRHTEILPSYDYFTGEETEGFDGITHYRMENGTMTQFTPQAKETSSVQLGTFDYITFNNYHELKALLENSLAPKSSHPYYNVLTKRMADINYDNLGYQMNECKGLLIDIDNDMTEELVIRYFKDYELYCDIWTIKNGQAVCIFSETIGVYAGAGPSGRLMLAEYMGETWLTLYREDEGSFSSNDVWILYQLSGGTYTKQHTLDKFSSQSIREVKQILNWEYGSTTDGSVYFEALTAKLQDYSAPAPGPSTTFTDVPADEWYFNAVNWAVENDIALGNGDGTFTPYDICSHIQILTFLWRAAGWDETAPQAPVETDVNVPQYRLAANWAYANGMIDENFDPDANCTRADAAMYIWQAFGKEDAPESAGFSDVDADADYAQAVDWAAANGITVGDDAGLNTFNPGKVCDRGEIVTFLHRAYVEAVRVK